MYKMKDPRSVLQEMADMPADVRKSLLEGALYTVMDGLKSVINFERLNADDAALMGAILVLKAHVEHDGDFKAAADEANRLLTAHGLTARVL
jgi:hypothetical protein